jgi:hypothetical protein
MTTHIVATPAVLALALICAGSGVAAQTATPAATGISGSWKVSLHGQHIIPVGMELKQDGVKISGTLMLWNGDVPLEGEIVDGSMKASGRLEPTDGTPAGDRTVTATVQPDGTLDGTFAGDHGKIRLTAERFTDRPTRRPAAPRPSSMPSTASTSSPADAAAFAGKWRLTASAGPDKRELQLELVAAHGGITGTVVSDHAGTIAIQNARVADGTLTFGVPMGTSAVEFTATLKGHGELAGTLAGPMGPMTFTAERVR